MEQVTELLIELATQLNTTVPYLWDAITTRVRYHAFLELIFNPFGIFFLYQFGMYVGRLKFDNDTRAICLGIIALITAVYVVVFLISVPNIIMNIFTPELRALELISEML